MIRFRKMEITLMTLLDLFRSFWPTEVSHHIRIA